MPAPTIGSPPAATDAELFVTVGNVLKPGRSTSEFALSVLATLSALVLCLTGKIDGDAALTAIALTTGAYAFSRGLAKR